MGRGVWQATVHGVIKESDTTKRLTHTRPLFQKRALGPGSCYYPCFLGAETEVQEATLCRSHSQASWELEPCRLAPKPRFTRTWCFTSEAEESCPV